MTIKSKEEKKAHMRMCIGCGEPLPKHKMLRVTKSSDGNVMLDTSGNIPGRSCYICYNLSCFEKALKKNRFSRSLRTNLLPDELCNKIKMEILNKGESRHEV